MKPMARWYLVSVLALAAAWRVAGAEEAATAQKPDATCVGCHGPAGSKPTTPDTPRLAGQASDYLVHALLQYRDGQRQNPIMGAMAKSLSDAQIHALAQYFAAQPGLTTRY